MSLSKSNVGNRFQLRNPLPMQFVPSLEEEGDQVAEVSNPASRQSRKVSSTLVYSDISNVLVLRLHQVVAASTDLSPRLACRIGLEIKLYVSIHLHSTTTLQEEDEYSMSSPLASISCAESRSETVC